MKKKLDIDWVLNGENHVFPHINEWDGNDRGEGVPFQGPPPPMSISTTHINGWGVAVTVVYWIVSEGGRGT